MSDPIHATSLSQSDTVFSADAIEFCPLNPLVFVCGTYQIEKSSEESVNPTVTRHGRSLLYEIDQDGSNLRNVQRFEGNAILDLKWSRHRNQDQTTLAIADAKGQVLFHDWDSYSSRLLIPRVTKCADESTLCLSLDWSDRLISSGSAAMVVSLSDGSVCTLGGETDLDVTLSWSAHDFEPWIAAFDCWNPNTVWTGGDDCKLKGWDIREGCTQPTFVNKKSFEGGVTTIQSHPLLENIFAVGSYDSHIRLFDRRKPLTPLYDHTAAGGIWRLKWHATDSGRILAAAMHGGFEVVDFNALGSQDPISSQLKARFEGHDSLAYGVDWSGGTTLKGKDLVASCSFYDHLVHVWGVER